MEQILHFFTNSEKINQFSEMTVGQSHLASAIIIAFASIMLISIIRNKAKKSV